MTVVGEPHLQTTTTSDTAEDYVEHGFDDGVASFHTGSRDKSKVTVQSTRCVRRALVDMEQDVELRPVVTNRAYDVLGGIGLAVLGGIVAGVAHADYNFERDSYNSALEFHQRDPDFFPKPTEPGRPTNYYRAGAVLGLAGAGVIAFSFGALPRNKPKAEHQTRRWTQESSVDATGCN